MDLLLLNLRSSNVDMDMDMEMAKIVADSQISLNTFVVFFRGEIGLCSNYKQHLITFITR